MLVGKQMVLAILVIPLAFGAKPEFQLFSVLFCPAADRALMLGHSLRAAHLLAVNLLSVNLLRRNPMIIPGAEKENQEI